MEKEKISVSEAVKSRLIDATLQSISDHGIADTTTLKISPLANVSTATIHHYFDSKEKLIYETMLHLLRLMGKESRTLMAKALTPRAKVMAIVESVSLNYVDNNEGVSAAWFAFWAQSGHMGRLARLMTIYSRRLRSNLRCYTALLLKVELPSLNSPGRQIEYIVGGITAFIHGTFVSLSIGEGRLTPFSASAMIGDYLDLVIGAHK